MRGGGSYGRLSFPSRLRPSLCRWWFRGALCRPGLGEAERDSRAAHDAAPLCGSRLAQPAPARRPVPPAEQADCRRVARHHALLGYRAYEPSNRELIDADPGCKARRYEDGAYDASQTFNRDAMRSRSDGFADALTHMKEVR